MPKLTRHKKYTIIQSTRRRRQHGVPKRYVQALYTLFLLILVSAGIFDITQHSTKSLASHTQPTINIAIAKDIQNELKQLESTATSLETRQSKDKAAIFDTNDVNQAFELIKLSIRLDDYSNARDQIKQLRTQMDDWQKSITALERTAAAKQAQAVSATTPASSPVPSGFSLNVPILIYHKTPANFDGILARLVAKGYRSITLDELATALRNKITLPGKPLVITIDDGFTDQLSAFQSLKKYNMKAIYYIISGGAASKYCIGANRANSTCGDGYLRWDEIRMLDQSGLIEIGGHTVDHLSLPAQTPAVQQFEIAQNKLDIEAQIGHPIRHFAYPYGSFNASTINVVRSVGYTTEVSTIGGTYQTPDLLYSLHRVRDADNLP